MPEQSFAVYRHEDKYLLSPAEAVYLRGLLRGLCRLLRLCRLGGILLGRVLPAAGCIVIET